ncbi:SHOCT domain-containing protein [Mycobacterium sp.]|uniref:SHOCT domain-containing protein n=1 Tax=Mycobacterium sp. TaxID=1785 RepID=UPI003F96DB5D
MCWGGNGWMLNGGYGWGWGWIITAVVVIGLFALLITAIVVAVRLTVAGRHGGAGSPQQMRGAENKLAERFARGDIDEDDYRRRMAALVEHR